VVIDRPYSQSIFFRWAKPRRREKKKEKCHSKKVKSISVLTRSAAAKLRSPKVRLQPAKAPNRRAAVAVKTWSRNRKAIARLVAAQFEDSRIIVLPD